LNKEKLPSRISKNVIKSLGCLFFFPFLFFQCKHPMPFATLGNNFVWIEKQKKRFHNGSHNLH
jgi:hypothetical protein